MSAKPINATESVEEANHYHNTLISLFDYSGEFSRKVGKCAAQTMYTFTREPKKKDKSKKIDPSNPFVSYLTNIENGNLDTNELYKWTTVYGDLKKPKLSLYDTTTVKRMGKTIDTTIGQLVINKTIFSEFWNNKYIDYVHYMTNSMFGKLMERMHQLCIEEKVTVAEIKRTVDVYCEFTLRMATVYNASVTEEMLNVDQGFKDYRDKELAKVKDQILENNDLDLLNKTIAKIIEFAKVYYKDNDMIELYESGGKSSWTGDFATMQIALGGMVTLTGDKPVIITESLSDGIPVEHMASFCNTGLRGAIDRGKETALAGEQYKNITNASQSIMGIRGDCGSKEGIKVNESDEELLYNKYVINKDKSLTKITTDNIKKFLNKDITLRDPSKCKQKNGNFCSTCIGTTPFDSLQSDKINLGLYLNNLASRLLNLFMGSTHELVMKTYNLKNFNEYIYPIAKKPMFYHAIDPIDGIEKVYTNHDIVWKIPKSAVTPVDTAYSVLAHGSVLTMDDDGVENTVDSHSIILGTEVMTNPFEIIKPSTGDNDDTKHYLFKYKKGDCVLNNTQSYKRTGTVYKMLKLYLRGAVSNLIPLEAHLMTLKNTFKTNKSLGKNFLSISILLASLARDAKDITKPSRETGTDDYIFVATDDLVSLSGTFNGIIGPDAGRSMFIAMARDYDEQTANPSPIERVFQS